MDHTIIASVLSAEKKAHMAVKSSEARYEHLLEEEKERLASEHDKHIASLKEKHAKELATIRESLSQELTQKEEAEKDRLSGEVSASAIDTAAKKILSRMR